MGKVNSLIFDWQQKIHAIEDYPIKISEAENVSELVAFVVDYLDLKYETDKDHVFHICSEDWNEYWSYYNM
tara:strand:+ start:602 stop:814 length:213 start_codon:yes stop_codon:yes gene_type:complete